MPSPDDRDPANKPNDNSGRETRNDRAHRDGIRSQHAPARTKARLSGRRGIAVGVTAILVVGALFLGFRPAERNHRQAHDQPQPVVLAEALEQDFPITLNALGTVQAYNTVEVHSQTTGTIDKVDFTEGQAVHAGDLLAQIDPRPLQAALGQAEAQLARDQANLANANRDLERYQSLANEGYATAQQFDTQKAAVAQSQAAIKGDESAVSGARTNLSYARITAPIEGVTGLRNIDVGNVVHPTDTTGIVTITTIEPITVVFTMPAQHLLTVQEQMAHGSLKAEAFDQDNKVVLDTGALKVVDNQIDPKTNTVRMKAEFPNKEHKLWPGAFVNVRLTVDNRPGVTVPVTALQHGTEGVYVYVVGQDRKAVTRPVELGETNEQVALIEHGVNVGEKVVVDGQARLTNGAMTREVQSQGNGEPANANQRETAASGEKEPKDGPAGRDAAHVSAASSDGEATHR